MKSVVKTPAFGFKVVGLSSEGVRYFSPQVYFAFFSPSPMRAEAPHYFSSDSLNVTGYQWVVTFKVSDKTKAV